MDSARILGTVSRMEHKHGNEWVPLREHHDPADHDAERSWTKGRSLNERVSRPAWA